MYNITSSPRNNMDFQMTKNNKNIPPGLMQYKLKPEHILDIDVKSIKDKYDTTYEYDDWKFVPHNESTLKRLTPNTKTGNANKWKLIFALKRGNCIKGALRNLDNNEIALMSSINSIAQQNYSSRTVKSWDPNYKICQCKMIAPLVFWNELKNRLLY